MAKHFAWKYNLLLLFMSIMLTCCHSKKTTKDNTKIRIKWGGTIFKLDSGAAFYEGNNLHLNFTHVSDSPNKYELELTMKNHVLIPQIKQTWSVTDCSYVASRFKLLQQNIQLNKTSFKKGDNIEGIINLTALGSRDYFRESGEDTLRQNYDTVKINGAFNLKIK